MSTISAVVKSIQDIMRQDAGIDGDAQRIGQLAWMLFLKILDDREAETELLDPDYRSPIPGSSAGALGQRRRRASPATSCSSS